VVSESSSRPRLVLTVTFAVLLASAEVGRAVLPARTEAGLDAWASTNVARLATEPVLPILFSPFVARNHQILWLALTALGMGIVEARWGWLRTLALVVGAHVAGTLVSEGIVWWRVGHGRLPESARHQLDVGVSYIAVSMLTAAVIAGGRTPLRIVAGVALVVIAPDVTSGLSGLDVAAVGHVTAFVLTGIVTTCWVVTTSKCLMKLGGLPILKA
jgi:hypothetical protein